MPKVVYDPVFRHPSHFLLRWLGTTTGLLVGTVAAAGLVSFQVTLGMKDSRVWVAAMQLALAACFAFHLRKLERRQPDADAPGETARLMFGATWMMLLTAVMI